MKNRKLLISVAALIVSAAGYAGSATAAELQLLPRASIKAEVIQSDKPVLLLSCSTEPAKAADCTSNENALAAQAAAHPEVKVVKISAEENNVPAGLYTYVPGSGLTYQQPGFDAAKVDDAFYSKRADFAVKEADAVKAYKDVQAKVKAATKVADDKMQALEQEDSQSYQDQRKAADALRAEQSADPALVQLKKQRAQQSAPYDKRIAALQSQIDRLEGQSAKATAATDQKIKGVQAGYAARREEIYRQQQTKQSDLQKRYAAAEAEHNAAAAPFSAEVKAAAKALNTLTSQDQPAD